MNKTFSIREALSFGWNTFKREWKLLVPLFVLLGIFQIVTSYLGDTVKGPLGPSGGFVSLFAAIMGMFFGAGMLHISLKLYKGEKAHIQEIVSSGKDAWRYFLGSLLFALMGLIAFLPAVFAVGSIIFAGVMRMGSSSILPTLGILSIIGLLLSFVLIFWLSAALGFWGLALFDHDLKVVESFKHSRKITKGSRLKLIGFFIVAALINILGFLTLGFGLLITIPLTMLAQVWVYKQLDSKTPVPMPTSNVPHKDHTEVVPQPKEIEAPVENSEVQA